MAIYYIYFLIFSGLGWGGGCDFLLSVWASNYFFLQNYRLRASAYETNVDICVSRLWS